MLKWLFETINRDYTETNSDKALGIASSDFTKEVLKSSNWGRFFYPSPASTSPPNNKLNKIVQTKTKIGFRFAFT